jgi:TetR/AcrR family transcriptional regulator, cholesterol catabolism regulator
LYMRYGIRSITMDEIASQLGISKKTIYQFFTDKDEMVEAVVDQEVKKSADECLHCKGIAENAVEEIFIAIDMTDELLKAMNPLIMYDLEKHHPKAFKKLRDHKYQFMYRMIKENLERGIKEELYRPEINIDVITKSRIESAFMGFSQDIFPQSKYKISEVASELAMFFLHGVTTTKGKKLIDKYSNERIKHKQRLYE